MRERKKQGIEGSFVKNLGLIFQSRSLSWLSQQIFSKLTISKANRSMLIGRVYFKIKSSELDPQIKKRFIHTRIESNSFFFQRNFSTHGSFWY